MADQIETASSTPEEIPATTETAPELNLLMEEEAPAEVPAVQEVKKEEPKKEEKKLLSPQLQAIAKRERANTLKEKELKEKESAFQTNHAKLTQFEKLIAEDPHKLLLDYFTHDQLKAVLTSFARGETQPEMDPHTKKLQQELEEIKKEKALEKESKAKHEASEAHKVLISDVNAFIMAEENKEEFEFIKSYNSEAGQIFNSLYFKNLEQNNWKPLEPERLVELVYATEKELENQATSYVERARKTKKFQQLPSESKSSITSQAEKKEPPKTLTNNLTSAANPKTNYISSELSADERLAALEEKFKGMSLID